MAEIKITSDEDEKSKEDVIEEEAAEEKEAENKEDAEKDSEEGAAEEDAIKAEQEPEDGDAKEGEEAPDEGIPEKIAQKFEEMNERHLRLMAEFENFRKRSEKEKEMMFETGAKSVIEKILPTIDNFERALDMAKQSESEAADPFMEGMEKVYKQLTDALADLGVKPIEAVGKPFDPTFHNAVMQEASDEYESGTVLKELQKGYMYRDSIVRHSMVSVTE